MFSNLKKKTEGFTIIEVLIVLAIAGLIMLIVFLAVPALQRNQRNNGRKSDVGRVSGAVIEWVSNNNGAVFTAGTGNANLTSVINSAGTLSQYTLVPNAGIAQNSLSVATGAQAAMPANAANLGSMRIVTGATCAAGGATQASTSSRRTALQSLLETAGTPTPICTEVN